MANKMYGGGSSKKMSSSKGKVSIKSPASVGMTKKGK